MVKHPKKHLFEISEFFFSDSRERNSANEGRFAINGPETKGYMNLALNLRVT